MDQLFSLLDVQRIVQFWEVYMSTINLYNLR